MDNRARGSATIVSPRRPGGFVLFFFSAALVAAALVCLARPASAARYLMSPSALHFDEPAPSGRFADMKDAEFAGALDGLKKTAAEKYGALASALSGDKRAALAEDDGAWRDFAEKYSRSLSGTLNHRIKVFYGVEGKERFTNVYMELTARVWEERIAELNAWSRGGKFEKKARNAPKSGDVKRTPDLDDWDRKVMLQWKHIVYFTPEKYRADEHDAKTAMLRLFTTRERLLRALSGDAGEKAAGEGLGELYSRMSRLLSIHDEGLAFFRTEKEE